MTESYATKEGKSITRQTGEIEWTAIRRTHDNQYQAVADEGRKWLHGSKGRDLPAERIRAGLHDGRVDPFLRCSPIVLRAAVTLRGDSFR